MSVGDGIFFSTLVVVAFASIYILSKHKKWKYVLIGIGVLGAFGAVIGIVTWYLDNPNSHRPTSIPSIGSIALDMKRVDVTLALGAAQRYICDGCLYRESASNCS